MICGPCELAPCGWEECDCSCHAALTLAAIVASERATRGRPNSASAEESPDDFVRERCPDCETPLVIRGPNGELLRFTAHDEKFCKQGMRLRIKTLEKVLETTQAQVIEERWRFMRAVEKRESK